MKAHSATYQMKRNFPRINNILSNNESVQIPRICLENEPKFFSYCKFLKKCSVNDFIFASYMLLHPNTTQNCRKTHSYEFPLRIILKAQCVQRQGQRLKRLNMYFGSSNVKKKIMNAERLTGEQSMRLKRKIWQTQTILRILRSLQLKTDGKRLRKRYGALHLKIARARHRQKLFTAIHHFNILPGEFDADFESFNFDEEFEPDPRVRLLSARVEQLQQNIQLNEDRHKDELQEVQTQYQKSTKSLVERGKENVALKQQNQELKERNNFLTNHADALETEVQENRQSLGLEW